MTRQTRLYGALAAVTILAAALTVAGCGSSGGAGASSMGGPIEVEVSQLFITITNRSGRAITDIKVEIIPIGRSTIFAGSHYRLENSAKMDFVMADLRGSDGTPFNLRVHKPDLIRVTATDLDNTPYEVELPWG